MGRWQRLCEPCRARPAGARRRDARQLLARSADVSGWERRLPGPPRSDSARSEEHTPVLQSLMRTSSAVFCLKKNIPYSEPPRNVHCLVNKFLTSNRKDTRAQSHTLTHSSIPLTTLTHHL